MRWNEAILLTGAAAGAILALYAETYHTESVVLKQVPITQQEVLAATAGKPPARDSTEEIPLVLEQTAFLAESGPEEWYGRDRTLTEFEWEAFSQMILSEARGESFEVQYYIACTVLNRVTSPLFPNTVAGVIYQTQPIQFYGAWDTEKYELTDCVLEAIQTALEENQTPSDLFYFTSEGWLPETKPWRQVGGMWFSQQGIEK